MAPMILKHCRYLMAARFVHRSGQRDYLCRRVDHELQVILALLRQARLASPMVSAE